MKRLLANLVLSAVLLGSAGLAAQASAAALTITKTYADVSDPIDGTVLPKAIPGAVIDYTIKVSNPNAVTVAKSIVITDSITTTLPAGADYYVGDLAGAGPVVFTDGGVAGIGGSGLTYTYTSLASTTDSLSFSNDGGVTWTYVPTPDTDGYDAAVTNIRVSPSSNFAASGSFTLRLRIRVKK